MNVMDRLILRLGVYEFLHEPETPAEGRHQRGAGARAHLQRRRVGAFHQRHTRRHPADTQSRMSTEESDQVVQRRANLEALKQLGVDPYPQAIRRRRRRSAVSLPSTAQRPERSSTPRRSPTRTAGRILAIRTFGKAGFLQLSDGRSRVQVYVRQDSVSALDFQRLQAARHRRLGRCRGTAVPDEDQRVQRPCVGAAISREVSAAIAGEVARPPGHRDTLSAALSRSDRQPGFAACLRGAEPRRRGNPRVPDRARVPRGRDADDAGDGGRRAGAPVRDAPQRARHAALHARSRPSSI